MVSLEEKVLEILKGEPAGLGAKRLLEILRKEYPREKHLEAKTRATLRKLKKKGLANSKRTHYVRVWRATKAEG